MPSYAIQNKSMFITLMLLFTCYQLIISKYDLSYRKQYCARFSLIISGTATVNVPGAKHG